MATFSDLEGLTPALGLWALIDCILQFSALGPWLLPETMYVNSEILGVGLYVVKHHYSSIPATGIFWTRYFRACKSVLKKKQALFKSLLVSDLMDRTDDTSFLLFPIASLE